MAGAPPACFNVHPYIQSPNRGASGQVKTRNRHFGCFYSFSQLPFWLDGKLIVSKKKIPPKDIAEAKKEIPGIVYSMCGNAKAAAEKREGHEVVPIDGVGVVPAGIVRVAELEEQGWTYIRP